MSLDPPLPRRNPLTDQVVKFLRHGITSGRWKKEMPSEAELCREAQVGRDTMRKALAVLIQDRWIEAGGRGRFHQVRRRVRHEGGDTARTVRLLTPIGLARWGSNLQTLTGHMTERLAAAGYRLEIEHRPGVFERFSAAKLKHLDALPDTAAWLLFYSSPEVQQWFASRPRPTVVAGRTVPGVKLSQVSMDGVAVGRHAAGLLVSRGHREVVYLIARITSLNDRLAAQAFREETLRLGGQARIVEYEPGSATMKRTMLDLIAGRPRITGFVTGDPEASITVLCHLLGAGVKVPEEANVIAMWDDEVLDSTYPTIARYGTNASVQGHKMADAILKQIRHGMGWVQSTMITPRYLGGGSVSAEVKRGR
ncbi:substrate-binding domain-containing protein [Luteolibacter sp. LG18]|uniref:substrate-binding domain-containing protein n=1 Tax=Luteolibacter sp. LG18 TaxID=2819286 RepID=UPI0030C6BA71